jgi:4-amino-4-deoxy-L-arabinose transferase-like glycosyltransferase
LITTPLLIEYSVKSSPFRAKVKQYFHYRMDSFDSHMLLLTGTIQIFEKYPLIGGGYGSFFEHFSKTKIAPTYFGRDPAALNTRVPAHTIWGELLAETGILGFTAFVIFCILIIFPPLYLGLRSGDKTEFLLGSVLSAVLAGWFAAGIFYSYNSEYFWIVILLFSAWSCGKVVKYISTKKLISFFFWSEKSLIAFLVTLSLILIFAGLGNNHLIPYDEAIYAKISKNMITTGNYLVQNWVPGKVWYEKPPLFMWMMSFMMRTFGVGSLAAKLPSAVFGFSLVLLVYFFSGKLFGKLAGFFSAFVLVTTTQFLYYSRMAMLDVTASFFITAALFAYYLSKQNQKRRYWILSGLAVGLAVMVKGVVGFLPLAVISLYELYLFLTNRQKLSKKLFMDYATMLFFSCLIFLPWHLEMYRRFSDAFINNYILYHVWDRATSAIEDKGRPFYWYLIVMKVSLRLWFVAFMAAFPLCLFKVFKKDSRFVFLLIWSLVVFLFFSLAKSKLVWYIMPIYPVVAIMVGYLLSRGVLYAGKFIKDSNSELYKIITVFFFVFASLFYLFLNKGLVYTSDLTGPQALLMQLKDKQFGVEKTLYVDRIELPLSLFYSDGPFVEIDFNPEKKDRVPSVDYKDALILLTKKGRFSEQVAGYEYKPQVVSENGDWVLWFMESRYLTDKNILQGIQERIKVINAAVLANETVSYQELEQLKQQETALVQKITLSLN